MDLKLIIQKNKAVIKFLLIFFSSYIFLSLLYQAYIKYIPWQNYYPDYITHKVAEQSYHVLDFLGYDTYINKSSKLPQMQIWINERPVVRIIEGCNSMSVIILFLSFILAFHKHLKKTLLYIAFGSFLIYALNVIRIALLTIGLYYYPEYRNFLHDIFFPIFIYGAVFSLWIFWIRDFKKNTIK